MDNLWMYIVGFIVAIVVGMCCHEYAHARVAYNCGDDTAKLSGRMTLNPMAHLDPLGFLALVVVGFGWAKPVPINPVRFKEYRKGMFLTSIAGILTNFTICFFASGISMLFTYLGVACSASSSSVVGLLMFLQILFLYIAIVNFSLAVFNLIPIYPLDGFNIMLSLTKGTNKFVEFLRKYGTIILLVLMLSTGLEFLMNFLVDNVFGQITSFWFRIIFGVY